MRVLNKIKVILLKRKVNHMGKNIHFGNYVKIHHPECLSLGNNIRIGDFSKIQTWPEYMGEKNIIKPHLSLGNDISLMTNCQISCANKITIGDGVLFGDNVFLTDNYHGSIDGKELDIPPIDRKLFIGNPIKIGKNVWVGRNVCIMPGVSIGDYSIIGANAVVTRDIPDYSVAVGVPAKVVKSFKEVEKKQ